MKKKISFITPNFDQGGAQKNMLNIINSLDSDLYDVDLLILLKNKNIYLKDINRPINVIEFKKSNVLFSLLCLLKYFNKSKTTLVFSSLENISLIIIFLKWLFKYQFINIIRLPTLPSNKLFLTYSRFSFNFYKSFIISFLYRFLDCANYIICQTNEMKVELTDVYNFENKNIIVIRNIVDLDGIKELAKIDCKEINIQNYNIIAIGALYSIKGYEYLLKGLALFCENHTNNNVILNILGEELNEIGYKRYLMKIVEDLDLSSKVVFHGHVKNPYMYLSKSNLFILSSLKEGFPNVVLEALTLNIPVVVTDCVDFNNIVDNNNGLVINKANANEISSAIEKFYFRNPKIKNIDIKNFDFNKWFKNIL